MKEVRSAAAGGRGRVLTVKEHEDIFFLYHDCREGYAIV